MKAGELIHEALRRELVDETGISIGRQPTAPLPRRRGVTVSANPDSRPHPGPDLPDAGPPGGRPPSVTPW
jgi:hypothetical protein